MKELLLYIEGLDCEDEARVIRARMGGLKGIRAFDINIMARGLRVTYDDTVIAREDIIKAIAETGLKAYPQKKREEVKRPGVWWGEPRILTLSACGFI